MSKRDQAIRQWKQILESKEPARNIQRGIKGDGNGTIRVSGRPDYVYVRVKARGTALWQCIDHQVADIEGLPVLIEKMPTGNDWQVIDIDIPMLANAGDGWEGNNYRIGPHASSHEWPDFYPGYDPVNVYPRSRTELRTQAKNRTELKVKVGPLRYTYAAELKSFYGTELYIGSYQPASGQAINVLTYLDPTTNTMKGHPGRAVTYSGAITVPLPGMPPYAIPSAVVRVTGDRSFVDETDIMDYRITLQPVTPEGISDLSNVNVSSPVDNEVLAYDTATSKWINQTPAEAGLAPNDPTYVVVSYDATLTNERMLVAGSGITLTDQGAGAGLVIASTAGGAPVDAPYLVTTYDITLTAERVIALGDGLKGTDAGAGAEYKIELDIEELPTAPIADDDWLITYDKSANKPSKIAWSSLAGNAWKLGNTIVVSTSGNGDYATLTAAFAAAVAGDTILVDSDWPIACNNLTLPDEVNLIGTGLNIVVLEATNATQTLTVGEASMVQNLSIDNLGSGDALKINKSSSEFYSINCYTGGGSAVRVVTAAADAYFFACYLNGNTYGLRLDAPSAQIYYNGGQINGNTSDVYIDDANSSLNCYEFPTLNTGSQTGSGVIIGWYFNAAGSRFLAGRYSPGIDMQQTAGALGAPADGNWRIKGEYASSSVPTKYA